MIDLRLDWFCHPCFTYNCPQITSYQIPYFGDKKYLYNKDHNIKTFSHLISLFIFFGTKIKIMQERPLPKKDNL